MEPKQPHSILIVYKCTILMTTLLMEQIMSSLVMLSIVFVGVSLKIGFHGSSISIECVMNIWKD